MEKIVLPSNRNFGLFFSFIFFCTFIYSYMNQTKILTIFAIASSLVFLFLSLTYPISLRHLNKLWMKFGLLLGLIISPIVIGTIFIIIFVPISIFFKLINRDELLLKFGKYDTLWKNKIDSNTKESDFKNQF